MSTLHHADILEYIFEDLLSQLEEAGFNPQSDAAQEVAQIRALQIFEERSI